MAITGRNLFLMNAV